MNLKLIGNTVSSVAEAIANVLDVDVLVADTNLQIIGNTYKYMVDNDITVSEDSIIGVSIRSGKEKVIIDNNEYEKCRLCKDRDKCKIYGVISIPIKYEHSVIGAIGIMLSDRQMKSRFINNLQGITVFLQKMSDLLSSKLASIHQVKKIEFANKKIEHIVSNVKDGIVYLDKENNIAYYNNVFKEYFNIEHDITGHSIESVLDHPIINNYIYSYKNVSDEIFVLQSSNINFKGLISCVNTSLNSEYLGTVVTFRKIEETHRVMNEMLNNKSSITFSQLISEDVDIKNQVDRAKKVAINDGNLLITGGSGTGKKTLAYSIHNFSARKSNYLITMDCKYLPREYYLSELFGIGENMLNSGKLQLAHKGTLIFNEIANLPLNIQKDLLTYISTGEVKMEKGVVIKDIDVRIIATTKYDLKQKVKEGFFNEELFYRLSVDSFKLKDLNDRSKRDFTMFVKNFLNIYSKVFSKPQVLIDEDGIDALYNQQWTENIRGLEKFLEQIVYHTKRTRLTKEDIERELNQIVVDKPSETNIKTFDEYEKEIIANALEQYKGVKNKIDVVADILGIGRATLYRKISKYDL